MPRARSAVECPRDPIGLNREEAAKLIGVGADFFERMVQDDRMPLPRRAGSRRIWDAEEVIAAFRRLPRELPIHPRPPRDEEGPAEDDPWDRVRA